MERDAATRALPEGFVVSHASDTSYDEGLRAFFSYRDLGVTQATKGAIGAHVIRANGAAEGHATYHAHALTFQFVYVTRGWVRFSYAGVGEVLLEAGSSVVQPPGIVHVELAHSADLEMLEITLPATFATTQHA